MFGIKSEKQRPPEQKISNKSDVENFMFDIRSQECQTA